MSWSKQRVVVNKFVGKATASLIFQERLTHENRARVEYYLSKKLTALFNFPTTSKAEMKRIELLFIL